MQQNLNIIIIIKKVHSTQIHTIVDNLYHLYSILSTMHRMLSAVQFCNCKGNSYFYSDASFKYFYSYMRIKKNVIHCDVIWNSYKNIIIIICNNIFINHNNNKDFHWISPNCIILWAANMSVWCGSKKQATHTQNLF